MEQTCPPAAPPLTPSTPPHLTPSTLCLTRYLDRRERRPPRRLSGTSSHNIPTSQPQHTPLLFFLKHGHHASAERIPPSWGAKCTLSVPVTKVTGASAAARRKKKTKSEKIYSGKLLKFKKADAVCVVLFLLVTAEGAGLRVMQRCNKGQSHFF